MSLMMTQKTQMVKEKEKRRKKNLEKIQIN
jgi:hypothetical protein